MSDGKGRVELIERFPGFFRATEEGFGLSDLGIWTGPGWDGVIGQCLTTLAGLGLPDDFRLVQIKEKFGELRIYHNGRTGEHDHAVEDAIAQATEASVHTCERCGMAGIRMAEHGWWRTLCASCLQRSSEA